MHRELAILNKIETTNLCVPCMQLTPPALNKTIKLSLRNFKVHVRGSWVCVIVPLPIFFGHCFDVVVVPYSVLSEANLLLSLLYLVQIGLSIRSHSKGMRHVVISTIVATATYIATAIGVIYHGRGGASSLSLPPFPSLFRFDVRIRTMDS